MDLHPLPVLSIARIMCVNLLGLSAVNKNEKNK